MAPNLGRDSKTSPDASPYRRYGTRTPEEQLEHRARKGFAEQQWRKYVDTMQNFEKLDDFGNFYLKNLLNRLQRVPYADDEGYKKIMEEIEEMVKDHAYYSYKYTQPARQPSREEKDHGEHEGRKPRGHDEDPKCYLRGSNSKKRGGGNGEGGAGAGVNT